MLFIVIQSKCILRKLTKKEAEQIINSFIHIIKQMLFNSFVFLLNKVKYLVRVNSKGVSTRF